MKEKFQLLRDRLFAFFSNYFRSAITLFIVILFQLTAIEILLSAIALHSKDIHMFVPLIARCMLVFSVALYACSHIACRSYVNCKQTQQHDDLLPRYRNRAMKNFRWGTYFFLPAVAVLIFILVV